MRQVKIIWKAFFFVMPFLLCSLNVFAAATSDDYVPEITARVARISFIRGDAQIRRADNQEWERATGNLPVVEGDEILTNSDSRLEIQFDSFNHLRLAENSYLKITTLRDEGIAVSLPQGTLSLRVQDFDKNRSYFEIDAPQTTVAVNKTGLYRVDAGDRNDKEIRVTVADSGEARVYSADDAGFTLRSGRSATVQIDGNYAGEWNTAAAPRYADEFESWVLERDAIIAKRLQKADYDKYYDRDIYGAEELSDYGEWIFTKKYGYVWRPFRTSISSYADWSPYRYGHWRWVSPYGWTWINDETWGWATYHHGRWIYDGGYWVWTPYAQYRARRSWWHPALVVVTYVNSYVCWYPLPYHYAYYNYNYYDRRRNTTIINNNTTINNTIIVNPTPTPTPTVTVGALSKPGERIREIRPPSESVPENGVVVVPLSQFGRDKKGISPAPVEIAKQVLAKPPVELKNAVLPTLQQLNGRVSKEILVQNPRTERIQTPIRTGAIDRQSGVSLDEGLRNERIFGNRSPINRNTETPVRGSTGNSETRDTGAVKRQPRTILPTNSDEAPATRREISPNRVPTRRTEENSVKENEINAPVRPRETRINPRNDREPSPPVRPQPPPAQDPPKVRTPQPRNDTSPQPVKPAPPQKVEPRKEPTRKEQPKEDDSAPTLNEGRKERGG